MAGHSHWAGIKHKKAANDAKKGKVFSRIAKLMSVAVKEGGGGDPDDNPRLRLILEKARQANMPKDNIKRAIEKALDTSQGYIPMTFESYGPAGSAIIVECLTDKTMRTGPEVRHLMEKAGAKLGKEGSVAYMFQRKGVFVIASDQTTEEALMDIVLEAGAEDIEVADEGFTVYSSVPDYIGVGEALQAANIETQVSELRLVPENTVDVDLESARKIMTIIEKIEDHEDVQSVYCNYEFSDEIAAQLAAE